jgi:glyoxylase-like metal-dependent hydrolase (beta-lactamase superfamily II)/rhodanese-related sulfurtransferase
VAPTVHVLHDEALANSSYLVEVGDGRAITIDPPRDVERHLRLAQQHDLELVTTLDTHLHADYVSGAAELAARGVDAVAPRDGGAASQRGISDGERLQWDDVALRALATPGHTPEHLAYIFETGGEPHAVFTGGSLILGGAARTDLLGDDHTDELARAQFHSLRRIAALPDRVAVYPTHGAGSFCLAAAATVDHPTVGSERRTNPLLAIDDEDAFVDALVAGFGTFPTYYRHLHALNQTGPRLLASLGAPPALTADEAARRVVRGALLVDARPVDRWAAAHPLGAVSIELRPAFTSWLGWAVPFGAPLVVIADEEHHEAITRLARRIGYDDVAFLEGGTAGWAATGRPVASVEEVDPDEARARQDAGALLVDVRQQAELAGPRLPGAVHVELGQLIAGATPDRPEAILFCGHGERSATGVSVLERRGVRAANLRGGIAAWVAAGLPVER